MRTDACDVADDGDWFSLVPYLHYVFSGAVSMALSVLWEKDFFVDFDGKHTFCCVPERYVSSC